MNNPLVSVITPVYNCAKYINKTMESVLWQKYAGNIQYIVIDDASTDNPEFEYQDMDEVEIHRHTNNFGEHITVNQGLRAVKGKYFMIVNADDPLLPDAINTLVEFMEANPTVLCAYPDYSVIDENGLLRWHTKTRDYDFTWMVKYHTWLPSVGSMFRSTVIKDVGLRRVDLKWLGDADYWLRIGLAGQMAHVPQTLACWRSHDTQLSNVKAKARAKEHIELMYSFFSKDVPIELRLVEPQAMCWAYLVAAAVSDYQVDKIKYATIALLHHPLLIVDFKFWKQFIKRAWFILRR